MNLLSKQEELLQKLHETNYALFDGDKEEALDFLEDTLKSFPDYTNIVIKEQIMSGVWKQRCDGDEYRENMQMIDRRRHDAHECAISNMDILNRFSQNLGLKPMFEINTNDRYAVADTVGQYVCEAYNDGNGKTFDDAVFERKSEYDPKKIRERLQSSIDCLSGTTAQNVTNYELG